ncbi:hypothetical protein CDD82_6385 [Ophiocordyceps australis]|uniref:DNA mismatch repair protein PMS1 n=1 Tax=Ophiocordyceps australis TaxID=1399860 RepID=A0A2C5YQ56_9HYPO|nr:hypothetical protein CDD82_6385 [Ophiocordyceps australis]
MATIKPIDNHTACCPIHQIQSGQVIVDLCSVVKELVENSIDAGATTIDVRVKNQGLDLIEVQDNGSGIAAANHASLALKHHTSKLSTYSDIASLQTFGFRGEALASLCALADLTITTCLEADAPRASRLSFDPSGQLTDSAFVAAGRGTTVSVQHLFHNLPVRRRELERNVKREWHKAVALLNQYACIQTHLKFSVYQQPSKGKRILLFSTQGNADRRDNIMNIFGARVASNLVPLDLKLELQPSAVASGSSSGISSAHLVRITGHVSRPSPGNGRQTPDRQMFYVNGRPCSLPQFARTFNDVFRSYNCSQSPFIFADIQLDTSLYDVNVSPDKRTILLHNQGHLLDALRTALSQLFDAQDQIIPASRILGKAQEASLHKYLPAQHLSKAEENGRSPSPAPTSDDAEEEASDSSSNSPQPMHSSVYNRSRNTQAVGIRQWLSPHSVPSSSSSLHAGGQDHSTSRDSTDIPRCEAKRSTRRQMPSLKDPCELRRVPLEESNAILEGTAHADAKRKHSSDSTHAEFLPIDAAHQPGAEPALPPAPPSFLVQDQTTLDNMDLVEDGAHGNARSPSDRASNGKSPSAHRAKSASCDMDAETRREAAVSSITRGDFPSPTLSGNPRQSTLQVTAILRIEEEDVSFLMDSYLKHCSMEDSESSTDIGIQDIESADAEKKLTLIISKEDFDKMRIVGQFNMGFIIAVRPAVLDTSRDSQSQIPAFDEVFIIDQHASDEKYNFEKLQRTNALKSQHLVHPKMVNLSPLEEEVVRENVEAIEANGFKVAMDMSGNAPVGSRCQITALPLSHETTFGIEDFRELVALLEDESADSHYIPRPSKVRKMFASRACRSSIMIGKALTMSQMRVLVRQMSELDKPWNCPHGRPTMRHLCRLKTRGDKRWDMDVSVSPLSAWKAYANGK